MQKKEDVRVARVLEQWDPYARRHAESRACRLKIGNAGIDDLVQAARMRLSQAAARGDVPEAHARRLIHSAVQDALREQRRRLGPTSRLRVSLDDDRADTIPANDVEPDLMVIRRVRAWIATLPVSLVRVYQALYEKNLSQREAAVVLGVTHQRVAALDRALKDRARSELKVYAA